jgi:hypothetical protein
VRLDAVKFAVGYLYGKPGLLDGGSEDAASLGRVEITATRVAEAQALLCADDEANGAQSVARSHVRTR